jgi:hypothetical protein
MKKLIPIAVFAIVVGLVSADGTKTKGETFQTDVKESKEPLIAGSKYSIWIPESTSFIQCVFVINMRGAGRHLFEQDQEWRALAKRTHSAILFCEFEAHGVQENGYGVSMLKACDQFAIEVNRPELKHAPFVLWGHSMGGRVAQDFVRFQPSRVLAFHIALRANPSDAEFMQEEANSVKVPGLYLMGEVDKKPEDIRKHFHHSRERKSPRAWIWLPGQSHWPRGMHFKKNETTPKDWRAWAANDVVIPWTEAMIRLRLPTGENAKQNPVKLRNIKIEKGWLGLIDSGALAPYAKFEGDKSTTSWYPNQEVANAWINFAFQSQKQPR